MSTITCSPYPPADPFPPAFAVRGVKQRLGAPYFASVHYTATMDAELAVGVMKEKKGAVVGLVGRQSIPITFYEHLVKGLPGHTFVDATDDIDRIMVPKSPEEQELIRRTAAIQDAAMEHLKKVIKPGMRDFEVLAEAQHSVVRGGSERQLILVSSAPPVNNAKYQFRHFQNRVIREGDRVAVLIETNGPGGFYTEIGRMFCLGQPPQELTDAYALSVEAQQVSLDLLKPGVSPGEIANANDAFLTGHGFFPERRLYGHGQGYNLVEPAPHPSGRAHAHRNGHEHHRASVCGQRPDLGLDLRQLHCHGKRPQSLPAPDAQGTDRSLAVRQSELQQPEGNALRAVGVLGRIPLVQCGINFLTFSPVNRDDIQYISIFPGLSHGTGRRLRRFCELPCRPLSMFDIFFILATSGDEVENFEVSLCWLIPADITCTPRPALGAPMIERICLLRNIGPVR